MKRILLVHNFYKEFGGEDSNFNEELDFFKQFLEVDIFTENNSSKTSYSDLISFFLRSNFRNNKNFKNKLDQFKPDVVYIHNTWYKINLGIFKILKDRNIETVLKIHNFRYQCSRYFLAKNHLGSLKVCNACGYKLNNKSFFNKYYQESALKSLFLILYSKKLRKILLSNNIKIFVLNKFHLNQILKFGVNQENVEIFYNPIKTFKKIQYEDKAPYIIYAGRISKEKGVEELLESWISAKIKNHKLLIIGDGPLRNELQERFESNEISFLGNIDNSKVKNYITNSKAVITATKIYEGQPRLLCEASSLGTISIYPSFGGMNEFFPSEYSFSFEQYNYIDLVHKIKLLSNEDLVKKNMENIYLHIQKILNQNNLKLQFYKIIKN